MKLLLAIGALASGAWATDLSGIWIGEYPSRRGDMQEIAFQFVQRGSVLEGKLYGDYKSTPISRGVVSGELVTFVVIASEQAGNQINTTTLRFTGSLKDGQLELTREREASTNAGNKGGVQSRGDSRQVFRVKKLI